MHACVIRQTRNSYRERERDEGAHALKVVVVAVRARQRRPGHPERGHSIRGIPPDEERRGEQVKKAESKDRKGEE